MKTRKVVNALELPQHNVVNLESCLDMLRSGDVFLDMSRYNPISHYECGSACCIVGIAYHRGIGRPSKDYRTKDGWINFIKYSNEVLLLPHYESHGKPFNYTVVWEYLFGIDNVDCHLDAIKRLNAVLYSSLEQLEESIDNIYT